MGLLFSHWDEEDFMAIDRMTQRDRAKSKALWDKRQADANDRVEAFSATTIPVADYYPQFCACCMKSKECVSGKCIKRLYDTDEQTRISPCYDFQPR